MTAASLGGFTMRNRVINGCCRAAQRGSATLTGSDQFGQVDRMLGSLAGTSLAGTLVQQVAGLASSMTYKRGVKFNDISFTSGYIVLRHRIEQLNTLDLSGNTVTVSAKVYHDYGSDATVSIGLRKPSAADNFASVSTIDSDASVSVPTGTTTTISKTYTLGSTDADNGLQIVIFHESRTVSVKNFVIGDIELQLGSEVGPFERRAFGTELTLCQRYFETQLRGWATSSSAAMEHFSTVWAVPKRAAPTVTFYAGTAGTYNRTNAGSVRNVTGSTDIVISNALSDVASCTGTYSSPAGAANMRALVDSASEL
jgi:hypothetical protein